MSEPIDFNTQVINEFRANAGVVGGHFVHMPLILLHTTGAKSHKPRINPLAYTKDGDNIVIIASKGGAPTNPDWFHNIVANPVVEVEIGAERFQACANIPAEPERTRLYDQMAAARPAFGEYREKTTRAIPVVTLTRVK